MENTNYTIYEKVLSQRDDKETEFEETLPEYLPGIEKVIFAKVIPVIRYERFDGKTLSVGVRAVFKAVFASDRKKQLKCMSSVRDFDFSFENPTGDFAEDSVSQCGVVCPFVSVRATGQRKLSFRARIGLSATVWSGMREEPFDSVDGENLICLRREISTVEMSKKQCPELRISKELELGSDMPAIEEIVDASADICVCRAECSEDGGKAYGNALLRTLYRTADDTYVALAEEIPFEAVLADCPKDGAVNVIVTPTSLSADSMPDNYGENRLISVEITADVSMLCRENKKAYLCEDAFCRNFACSVEVKTYPEKRVIGTLEEKFKINGGIGTSSKDLTNIIETEVYTVSVNTEYMDGKIVISGKMSVFVLGTGADGDIKSVEGILPYNAVFNESVSAKGVTEFDTSVCVIGAECTVSQGEIICNAEICARSTVTESMKTGGVSAVDIDESAPCSKPDNELVICYPSKSDTLWSVAKKYKVAPEAIAAANKMSANTFATKTVIIPMKA